MTSTDTIGLPNDMEGVVRRAGQRASKAFHGSTRSWSKPDGSPLTDADLAVEQFLKDSLSERFPDHGFVCEESETNDADAEFVWIIDPIDGTAYFSQGIPLYSVSVALRRGDDLVLGLVFNPETDEMFTAAAGEGAALNGEPLKCSELDDLAAASVCVEIPNRRLPGKLTTYALDKLGVLMRKVHRLRVLGVSALGLCYTAGGGFDAYVNMSGASKIWDLAAGQVILREAGGVYTQCENHVIVAGPPPLHDQLVELLELPVSA